MEAMEAIKKLLTQFFLKENFFIGEIVLSQEEDIFFLRHRDDAAVSRKELKFYDCPAHAREIACYDKAGHYRPLKSAPNLARGWLMQLQNSEEVALALDFFYPAALNLYAACLQGTLETTPLRKTLSRQTGMYRITQQLSDDQAQSLIGKCCRSEDGCLRKVLWTIAQDQPITSLPEEKMNADTIEDSEIPLLCREACNYLVAAARDVVKKTENRNY